MEWKVDNNQPKSINFIVIGIWVLIGLAVIFSLFDGSKIKNLELYVQLIAALATIGSVYFAYQAIRLSAKTSEEMRSDRELELANRKPEFRLMMDSIKRYTHGLAGEEVRYEFEAGAQQLQVHPATLVTATAYLIDWELNKEPSPIFREENANDVHQLTSVWIKKDGLEANSPDKFTYLVFDISFQDKITGRKYNQTLYKKLEFRDDEETWYYEDVGHKDRERLESYIQQYK